MGDLGDQKESISIKKDDHLLQFAVNTLAGLRKALEVDA